MTVKLREIKAIIEDPEDPKYIYRRQLRIMPGRYLEFGRISLTADGVLSIRSGYVYDFASGAIDSDSIKEGSLVHDALCELIHNDLLSYHEWEAAADEMKDTMREYADNHSKWMRHARYARAEYTTRVVKLAGPTVTTARVYRTI